jgi:hypothetical protein
VKKKYILANCNKFPEKTNQRLAAQQLGIPQSTLNKLVKSRNEINDCTESQNRAIEEHNIGTNYFDTLNNLEHIMMVSIPKKLWQITDFFEYIYILRFDANSG